MRAELEGTWEEYRNRLARENVAQALERFRLGLSTSMELSGELLDRAD